MYFEKVIKLVTELIRKLNRTKFNRNCENTLWCAFENLKLSCRGELNYFKFWCHFFPCVIMILQTCSGKKRLNKIFQIGIIQLNRFLIPSQYRKKGRWSLKEASDGVRMFWAKLHVRMMQRGLAPLSLSNRPKAISFFQ